VFSILSGATVLLLNYFDSFSRQDMLEHRGVVIKANVLGDVDYANALTTFGTSPPGAEAVIYYKCVDFGTNLRICSINTQYVWGFSEIKPNDLVAGNFPSNDQEVLISDKLLVELLDDQPGTAGDVNIYTEPVVGTKFKLGISNATDFVLIVSGIYKKPNAPSEISTADSREWIFISEAAFEELISGQNLGYSNTDIDFHSVTLIASGDVFLGESYNNVDSLASIFGNLGSDYQSPIYTEKADKDEDRTLMLLSLFLGIFGTFMVSTLYSYLITRFRRREVAVLKAMGYSKWNIRTVVLSEILVVAITGFLIGLSAIQAYLIFFSQGSYIFYIIFSSTAILAFIAVVISCVPGFILITTRTLAVRPIELFRQK
jgi:ABC-type antimicrobial peptide transport system permease subunit